MWIFFLTLYLVFMFSKYCNCVPYMLDLLSIYFVLLDSWSVFNILLSMYSVLNVSVLLVRVNCTPNLCILYYWPMYTVLTGLCILYYWPMYTVLLVCVYCNAGLCTQYYWSVYTVARFNPSFSITKCHRGILVDYV